MVEYGPRRTLVSRRSWLRAALSTVTIGLAAPGCGYHLGAPYQQDIRSVEVPIFTTDSFRRGLEDRMTEAVQRRIQQRTHFRLAKAGDGDTVLTGRIVKLDKTVLGESAFDDPREIQVALAIQVTWEDRRNGQILRQQRVPIDPELVPLVATADSAPEIGQSLGTGTQQAIERLAAQIVELMESPW